MFLRENALQNLENILKTEGISSDHITDILNASKNWSDEMLDRISKALFSYCELHVHTDHSLLDGVNDV